MGEVGIRTICHAWSDLLIGKEYEKVIPVVFFSLISSR